MEKVTRLTLKAVIGDTKEITKATVVAIVYGEVHAFKEKPNAFDPSIKDTSMQGVFRAISKNPAKEFESDLLLLPEKITAKIRAGGAGTSFAVKVIADGKAIAYDIAALQTPVNRIKALEDSIKAEIAPAKK
jgi:hypothetical protein